MSIIEQIGVVLNSDSKIKKAQILITINLFLTDISKFNELINDFKPTKKSIEYLAKHAAELVALLGKPYQNQVRSTPKPKLPQLLKTLNDEASCKLLEIKNKILHDLQITNEDDIHVEEGNMILHIQSGMTYFHCSNSSFED